MVQIVNTWPDRRTVEFRADLSESQLQELKRLIAAVDFAEIAQAGQQHANVEDVGQVAISIRMDEQVLEFSAPLMFWARAHTLDAGHRPAVDFAPALQLWEAIDRFSPHRMKVQ